MSNIPYTAFFQRLLATTDIKTQMDLANALGVHRSAITQAKLRDAVPQKWILTLARRYTVSPDWLEFGKKDGQKRAPTRTDTTDPVRQGRISQKTIPMTEVSQTTVSAHAPAFMQKRPGGAMLAPMYAPTPELIHVPKVRAQLCAGGGSFAIEAIPVSEHPFPKQWLSRMGNPSAMVFMDVIGNSMEPSIYDGDMVLVDQSGTRITPHSVFAVGVEDSIYIKRVEQRPSAIILHSDNPDYSDMELYGDELETFRVIGKVVWLCRDFR